LTCSLASKHAGVGRLKSEGEEAWRKTVGSSQALGALTRLEHRREFGGEPMQLESLDKQYHPRTPTSPTTKMMRQTDPVKI